MVNHICSYKDLHRIITESCQISVSKTSINPQFSLGVRKQKEFTLGLWSVSSVMKSSKIQILTTMNMKTLSYLKNVDLFEFAGCHGCRIFY